MALVAAAVANGGTIMTPHVMREVRDDQGDVVDTYDPRCGPRRCRSATAETLREAMIAVVTDGTAERLDDDPRRHGRRRQDRHRRARTSAEPSANAWIIGFAGPEGQPAEVAVAVLVEAQPGVSEQTGGRVAAPIAAQVLRQALTRPPGPSSLPATRRRADRGPRARDSGAVTPIS